MNGMNQINRTTKQARDNFNLNFKVCKKVYQKEHYPQVRLVGLL